VTVVSRATIETATKRLEDHAHHRFRKAVFEATPQTTTTKETAKETATVAPRIHSVSEHMNTGSSTTDTDTDIFSLQLHDMLDAAEEKGHAHIVSWCDDGVASTIHDPSQPVLLLQHYFCRREQTETRYDTSF